MGAKKDLTRRSFIAGAAVAAATAGLVSCSEQLDSSTTAPNNIASAIPETWDREVDVVLLGTGSAISAAYKAADLDLEILVLEKQESHFGGTTRYAGGALSCPNSRLALEAGKPEIPRQDILDYMILCAKDQYDLPVLEKLLDSYNPVCNYLMDECGFQFSYIDSDTPYYAWYTPFFEREPIPGISCTLWPVAINDLTNGRALMEYAKIACEDRDIEIMYNTKGADLIYSGNSDVNDGEVVGIWAEDCSSGKRIAIKTRKGVILGCGGYDFNREMVQHYLPGPIYSSISIDTNEGDGHRMAAAVGAEFRNMNETFRYPFIMTQGADVYKGIDINLDNGVYGSEQISKMSSSMVGKTGSLIVNKQGFRMGNESSPYAQFPRVFDVYDTGRDGFENIPGFWICDADAKERYSLPGMALQVFQEGENAAPAELEPWITEYQSLEELAEDKGINVQNLLDSVTRFNGMCESGIDPDWLRGEATFDQWTFGDTARVEAGELKNSCLAPLTKAPYYCVEYYPGMLQTSGGVRINENAQAMHVNGTPISRLYVSSCTMAMPLGRGYGWAGGTMVPGFVFGYVAAEHLATLESL